MMHDIGRLGMRHRGTTGPLSAWPFLPGVQAFALLIQDRRPFWL
jgi:hypothetical protein